MITSEVFTIRAGDQFLGTEFRSSVASKRLKEVNLELGPEEKTWSVVKKLSNGAIITLAQSIDAQGDPGPSSDTSVVLRGEDYEVIIHIRDSIQVISTSATSAMRAKLYFEDL